MVHLIQTGRRSPGPALLLTAFAFIFFAFSLNAQNIVCDVTSSPQMLRPEGLSERTGDIVVNCSGTPGQTVTVNVTLSSTANITNRLLTNGAIDLQVTEDGAQTTGVVQLTSNTSVNINGLRLTIPASGTTGLTISNLRVNATQLNGGFEQVNIGVSNGSLALNHSLATVGLSGSPTVYATVATYSATRPASVPATLTIGNFFSNQNPFFSTRVTEGFPAAFTPAGSTTSNGLRLIVQYAGYPAGAQLFVPDAIAGSSTTTPTTAGDFGGAQTGGTYTAAPGGTLLLSRVKGADANGAGGTPVFSAPTAGSSSVSLTSVSEVPLTDGAGYAVYEVLDANSSITESAQIPTFIAVPGGIIASTSGSVMLAPISNVGLASTDAPIPRFVLGTPSGDCSVLGDCNAGYFPHLAVSPMQLQFTASASGSRPPQQFITVSNSGGGSMAFKVTTTYQSGSGWLTVDPQSGTDFTQLRLTADASKLAPGTYNATLVIDAGPSAGSKTVQVTFTVTSAVPVISAITNAADFKAGAAIAPGSIATAFGSLLNGANPMLYFSGMQAQIFYDSANQINFLVPSTLTGATAQGTVIIEGQASTPITIQLTPVAPAIFRPGILNQDSTVNSLSMPAVTGTIVQVFATGVLPPSGVGTVTAKIHDRDYLVPLFAGPAPGFLGLQQINVVVPEDLPTTVSEIKICTQLTSDAASRVCSAPAPFPIKHHQ
jgi:uncharacterized protein (TIGR03437 family)